MKRSFNDQYAVHIGFFALFVGLAAFKDELNKISIELFSHNFSLLFVSIPLFILMIASAYFAAAAVWAKNVSFMKTRSHLYICNFLANKNRPLQDGFTLAIYNGSSLTRIFSFNYLN